MKNTRLPKPKKHEILWIKRGLLGVLVAYFCGVGFYAATLPWKGTADSPLHLDYIWQVYKGDLPQFWEGSQAPFKKHSPVQFVSQHPPLYHAVVAPFAGPALDQNSVRLGVAITRFITICMGALSVLAFAWAGWVFGGRHRTTMAIVLPGLMTALLPFIKVTGDVVNDTLIVLTTTLSLTISARIIQNGITKKYVILAAVVSLAGMASRAPFISTLLLCFGAVYLGVFWHQTGNLLNKFIKASLVNLFILGVVLVGIGWFYLRNFQASGHWHRSGPQEWAATYQGRPYKSLSYVLTRSKLWLLIPTRLFGNPWGGVGEVLGWTLNSIGSLALFSIALAGNFRVVKKLKLREIAPATYAIVAMLAIQFGVVFLGLISHATGYGTINIRYFLPAWLPLGMFLVYGIYGLPRGKYKVSMAAISLSWLAVVANTVWFLQERYPSVSGQAWERVLTLARQENSVPGVVIYVLLVGLIAGVTLQIVAIARLSRLEPDKS